MKTLLLAALLLTWNDNNTSEDGFVLDRQINGGVWTVLAASIGANVVSYSDATAVGSTSTNMTYCYRIKAFRGEIEQSPYSNVACKTIPKIRKHGGKK